MFGFCKKKKKIVFERRLMLNKAVFIYCFYFMFTGKQDKNIDLENG